MISNQLFKLLSNLNRKEMTRFKEFSLSPYFNKHLGVSGLVEYLNGIYPEFTEKNCSKAKLMQVINHHSAKSNQKLAVLFTYTRRLFDQFLSLESFKGIDALAKVTLLQQLRKKGHYRSYEKTLNRGLTELESTPFRDGEHYRYQFLLAQEADLFYTQLTSHEQDYAIQKKENALDVFYLSEKLKDACEMKVRRRIISVDYSESLMEVVIDEVATNPLRYADKPPIVVYFSIYQMMTLETKASYQDALEQVKKYAAFFPMGELKSLYNFLLNFCVNQINKGRPGFLKASFELYQIQLERDLLLINDILPEWHYKNIVTTALRLQEMEWVYEFIESYQHLLSPEVRDNAYSFNLASYYYSCQLYDKALQLLTKVEYTDLRYNLSARALLLRTYYDLEEHEALISLCKSFKQFLQRHKEIAEFRRKGYRNLFDLTRKASQLRNNLGYVSANKSKLELEKLKMAIAGAQDLFNRVWLEQRVASLEQVIRL